jgi:cob(I)alamin adenosyltransferase
MLGVALAHGAPPPLAEQLADIQALLLELGADLATPPGMHKGRAGIVDADIERLERAIDDAEAQLPALGSFILPAGTPVATALHVARAVCRRAERRCVTLRAAEPDTSDICVRFLNRLSDLLFVLARLANHQAGVPDSPWRSRAMG